jgi:uncharacterized protein related to proFAR isomerase
MKIPKMNIMSKKNKKQNAELIERINEIQSQLNDVKSDAGVEVEEGEIVFTRQQLEDFLVEYTNKVNQYIFDEAFSNIDSDEVVSFDVDGREINTYVDEDKLRDAFTEATESVESDIIMEYADEAMSEVGVI